MKHYQRHITASSSSSLLSFLTLFSNKDNNGWVSMPQHVTTCTTVGFVAAAVSVSTGGCRAISFDEVSVAAELAVL